MFKMRMKALLSMHELMCVVELAPAPASGSALKAKKDASEDAAAASEEVRKKKEKAWYYLLAALDDARMQMMVHIKDGEPALLWSELLRINESNSQASKAHTRSMLHKTKMDFDVYKSQLLMLSQRLVSLGEGVSDSEMLFVLLEGLPRSWEALKQTLFVQADTFSFESMCTHIRNHQEKSRLSEKEDAMEQANYAGRTHKHSREHMSGGGKGGYSRSSASRARAHESDQESADEDRDQEHTCQLCNKKGHWEGDCSQRRGRGRDCFACGEGGHRFWECKRRKKEDRAMFIEEDEEEELVM